MEFNGGKMAHIFKLVDNLYVKEFSEEGAESAFLHGRYYVKVDGANHMIIKNSDDEVELYARYDVGEREMPATCIPIPAGKNGMTYVSRQKTHTYYYKPTRYIEGKLAKVYDILQRAAADYVNDKPPGHYSVEVVGRKFQNTPGVDCDGALAVHSQQTISVDQELRTFTNIRRYLLEAVCIEGVVVEHEGRFWKIRSNCFDKDCLFEKVKRGKAQLPATFLPPVLQHC